MKKLIALCALFFTLSPAYANWEYPGTYIGDGYYTDNGTRFVVSLRGGAVYGTASIKNQIGTLVEDYYDELDVYLGSADLGTLSPVDDFSGLAVSMGGALGVTLPNAPQWRLEAGWDHMSKMDYNAYPLMRGVVTLTGGEWDGVSVDLTSGDVHSTLATDVFSVMAYYDFFDGMQKPAHEFIPYIGFGIGYADSTTVLNMTDVSGYALAPTYGEIDETTGFINFYESTYSTANVAGLLALGLSYGLSEYVFLDLSARATYIPAVKFTLSNEDGSRHRDWFAAENLLYFNAYVGLRFEF